jgi:DNA excision repair protein ERCC-2
MCVCVCVCVHSVVMCRFEQREDVSVIRNYGALLLDVAKNVPDGICCFFTR